MNISSNTLAHIPDGFEVTSIPQFLAAAGLGAAGVIGAYWERRRNAAEREQFESVNFPNPTQQRGAERSFKLQSRVGRAAVYTASLAAVAAGLNAAGPYTEETTRDVETVAVVFDAGHDAYAPDMDGDTRLVAALEGTTDIDSNGADIHYFAAGATVVSLGFVEGGNSDEGIDEVYGKAQDFIDDLANRRIAGADDRIADALAVSGAVDPDLTLVVAGRIPVAANGVLAGQAVDGVNDAHALVTGSAGSTVDFAGSATAADFDPAGAEALLGADDVAIVRSSDEIRTEVERIIIDNTNVETERTDSGLFEGVRNRLGALVISLTLLRRPLTALLRRG